MVGNPSFPAIGLGAIALGLHATTLLPHVAADEDLASAAVAKHDWSRTRSKKNNRHLRRSAAVDSRESSPVLEPKAIEQPPTLIIDRVADESHRRLGTCLWHPEVVNRDGCSNDDNIPDEWVGVDINFHLTSEACCAKFFNGKDCKIYDRGCQAEGEPAEAVSCISHGWHADLRTRDGCTDDDNYSEEWLLDDQTKKMMFHATPEECCAKYFADMECIIRHSSCAINEGSSSTTQPSCVSPGWYSDSTHKLGCTNGNNYPKHFLETRSTFFSPTFQLCCDTFFKDKDCKVYDKGCTIDASMYDCESEWHPDTETKTGCSNDSNYPLGWKKFPTAQDCCQDYHHPGDMPFTCQVRDACNGNVATLQITAIPTSSPTLGCMWHPSMQNNGSQQCDYSNSYPPAWIEQSTFNTHEECCWGAYGKMNCGKGLIGFCEALVPTSAPIISTGFPSSRPIPSPSASPTEVFYVHHFSGLCVRESEVPKPYYIDKTYLDYDECCKGSPKKSACMAEGPTEPPTILWPTFSPEPTTASPTALIIYWVDHHTGLCIEGVRSSAPYHIKLTFVDSLSCCEHSFAKNECLDDLPKPPTRDPTNRPSAEESSVPSSRPSSTQPSNKPSEGPVPTTSPTTFYWGALTAFSSKPTHRPTKEDCSESFWHVDAEAPNQGCTNYGIDSTQRAVFLFQTAQLCCAFSFEGLDCSVRDNCGLADSLILAEMNLSQPEDACENWWHPDTKEGLDGCSNDRDIPASWKLPKNKAHLLFDTARECCQKHYVEKGYHCKTYNHCATQTKTPTKHPTPRLSPQPISTIKEEFRKYTTPLPSRQPISPQVLTPAQMTGFQMADAKTPSSCQSAKWHIAAFSDELTCSNSLTYPVAWDDPSLSAFFLFDSHSDCCARYAPFNPDACGMVVDCVDATTTMEMESTAPATTTVIGRTNDPLLSSKTCVSTNWHMSLDFSKCINDFEYPSSWPVFDNPAGCCIGIFNYADCEVEDICASEVTPTITKTQNPTQEPSAKPSTGMPTRVLLQKKSDEDNKNGHCSGKSRRKCFKDSACQYDRTDGNCVKMETTFQTKPKATTSTTKPAASVTSLCGRKQRRPCIIDPECIWDKSENSCAQFTATLDEIHENESGSTHTTTVTSVTTPTSHDCGKRRWHPKTIADRTCSNSDAYPSLWDNHPYSEQYLFKSFELCCTVFYGGACKQEDVCEVTARRWLR